MFLVGVFEENARLLQWLVFFRQFNAMVPLFCSFVQHHQLELRTSKTYSKRQNLIQNKNIDVQNLENVKDPLWCFSLGFFRYYATFLKIFSIPPKGLPFVCFDILQHNGCQKIPNGPPFSRRFRRKSTTFTVASFFSSVQRDRSTFFVHFNFLAERITRIFWGLRIRRAWV